MRTIPSLSFVHETRKSSEKLRIQSEMEEWKGMREEIHHDILAYNLHGMDFLISVGFSCIHMRCSRKHTSIHLKNICAYLWAITYLINKMKCKIAATPTEQPL